jgi:hypothetical protein
MKKFYQSKTFWVGALQILSGILLAAAQFVQSGDFSTPAVILFFNGVIVIVLRFLTNSGIEL